MLLTIGVINLLEYWQYVPWICS